MEKKNIIITPKEKDGYKVAFIVLVGELSSSSSSEMRLQLISAINRYDQFELSLKDIENIDLSCIQLLYSFQRALIKLNKRITINSELPEKLHPVLQNSGFSELLPGTANVA